MQQRETKMGKMVLVSVVLLGMTGSASAETKGAFCNRMYALCLTKCPPGSNCRSCPGKLADCQANGCFAFLTAGTRCYQGR